MVGANRANKLKWEFWGPLCLPRKDFKLAIASRREALSGSASLIATSWSFSYVSTTRAMLAVVILSVR